MTGPKLLRDYLRASRQRPADLSRTSRISEGQLSRWLRGQQRPNLDNAELVERLTAGAVPASSWSRYARRDRRAS